MNVRMLPCTSASSAAPSALLIPGLPSLSDKAIYKKLSQWKLSKLCLFGF
jgi:hypothetical protein